MPTTLLFVDDNLALVESATRYMGKVRPEWRFLLANTCGEARKLYCQGFPDAAVLDIDLPDGNGMDLLSEFNSNRPGLPVIVISGDDPAALRQEVLARGGYSFLSKPFSGAIMVNDIESAIIARSIALGSKYVSNSLTTRSHETSVPRLGRAVLENGKKCSLNNLGEMERHAQKNP